MNEQSNKILCPDCERNYIDRGRYASYGKCVSCQRRETIARTKNNDYIKFKDLPQVEKDRLDKQRETNNNWNKRKHSKSVTGVTPVTTTAVGDDDSTKKFLLHRNYLQCDYVSIASTELYQEYIVYCGMHYLVAKSRVDFYKDLREKFGFVKIMSGGVNYYRRGAKTSMTIPEAKSIISGIKPKIEPKETTEVGVRSNQIYTPKMINEIKFMAKPTISVKELRELFVQLYPDKNITVANFNNIIARHKIPHLTKAEMDAGVITEPVVPTQYVAVGINTSSGLTYNSNYKEEDIMIKKEEDNIVKENPPAIIDEGPREIPEPVIEEVPEEVNTAVKEPELDEDGDPIRLKAVKAEVNKVLHTKFNAMGCETKLDIELDAYIKLFEMLQYLTNNVDNLIKMRNNQYDVTNMYQDDVLHEMENTLAKEGDTYLSDKMYVLRDYRRFIESDRDALRQMKSILNELGKIIKGDKVKKVLGQLNFVQKNNNTPKFIPTVDLSMINKYNWAIDGTVYSPKNRKAICVTNELEKHLNAKADDLIEVTLNQSDKSVRPTTMRLSQEEIDRGFGVFRVSCKLSGGGHGAFKSWYKDYPCVNEEIALSFAQQEFTKMKAAQRGLLITELEVHKLNI